jgi:hypothetical protein
VLPGGALGPGIAQDTSGLFLLPTGRLGRCFTGMNDEDPAASGAVLFLLPRGRPRLRGTIGMTRFIQDPSALAMEAS